MVKTEWEIGQIKKACEITDQAFSEVLSFIRPGISEREIADFLEREMFRRGAGESNKTIVAAGKNGACPHHWPTDSIVQKGDFVTMDFGCTVSGYCSDMTRTVALGFVSEEMSQVYETVLRAQETAIAMTKAGVTGQAVDGTARKIIADAGYGAFFGHGYGHSVGLEIHEAPNCNASNDQPLAAGVVCSAEPGIYLPEKFGVRIEDVVVVTEDGCRVLTKSPKNLMIL